MTDTTGPVLADEPLDRFQPLGVFGQPVHQSHIQLQAALKRRLGDRYANFFSTPHIDAQGERVSWRSPVAGDVRRWSDLSDEEQADRALDLQVMKSELEVYMSELRAFEGQGKDAKAATAFVAVLEQALKTPNDGYLFFVGDQPVSAFWGFREEEAAPFETLTAAPRVRQAAAASPAAAPPVEPSSKGLGFPWWWLLIPLLLLLLLFLIWWFWPEDTPAVDELGDPPAIENPQGRSEPDPANPEGPYYFNRDGDIVDRHGNIVPPDQLRNGETVLVPDEGAFGEGDNNPAVDEDGDAVVDGAVVDDSAEGAVDNDPAADADTPVEPETPLDQEVPEVPEGEDTTGQNDEAQQPTDEGEAAETPETPETPVPEPETQDPEQPSGEEGQTGATGDQPDAPAPNPGEAPDIPENAADGAAGFMQGDWQSDSGLVDGQSGGRLSQEFKFDENGQGETVVRKSNGVTCRAPAEATVRDGNLHVEEKSNLKCTDGSSFKRSKTVCIRGQDGQARCRGVDSDGKQFDVQMNRGAQP